MVKYESWGRYPRVTPRQVHSVYWLDEIESALTNSQSPSLPYGMGRSYGDACLIENGDVIDCTRCDRILAADWTTGVIKVEAGVTLAALLEVVVPRGWFLPVTPGTKFVTVGGAVANDVHGKNHHRAGTLGRFVKRLLLYRSDGSRLECSRETNADIFSATIAGLGLTGVIGWVELQLKPITGSWIDSETIPFSSVEEFQRLSDASDSSFEYTVAWVDCFDGSGRGIFFRGNHSPQNDGKLPNFKERVRIPITAPDWLLSKTGLQLFNSAYYRLHASGNASKRVLYDGFFYPLDSIRDWNLMYGKRGFLQYQFVIPSAQSAALRTILAAMAAADAGSFLAVLKKFGAISSPGMMSFPREGLTLALDLPFRGEKTLNLLNTLDSVVLEAKGAIYPAKDARMSPAMFRASFPRLEEFKRYIDPKMSSSFWKRVTEA
jgi:FAD/FMN-containing dehydrogenase